MNEYLQKNIVTVKDLSVYNLLMASFFFSMTFPDGCDNLYLTQSENINQNTDSKSKQQSFINHNFTSGIVFTI